MKKAYIVIGVIYYAILGCHAGKKHVPGADALTASELWTVKAVNHQLGMALDLARQAGSSGSLSDKASDAPDEKAVILTKMIQDGKCAQTFQKPSDNYDLSWQAGWQVSSATCPISVNETTDYQYKKIEDRKGTKISGILSFHRNYDIPSGPEGSPSQVFRKTLGVSPFAVHGTLNRGQKANGKFEVAGTLVYDEYVVDNIGRVNATITIIPYEDGGSIRLKLTIEEIVANLEIRWNQDGRSYILNGSQALPRADFLALFSSFELLELLDRIQKMG